MPPPWLCTFRKSELWRGRTTDWWFKNHSGHTTYSCANLYTLISRYYTHHQKRHQLPIFRTSCHLLLTEKSVLHFYCYAMARPIAHMKIQSIACAQSHARVHDDIMRSCLMSCTGTQLIMQWYTTSLKWYTAIACFSPPIFSGAIPVPSCSR